MKKLLFALTFFILGGTATLITSFSFAQSLISFPDVSPSDWYYNDVNNMVSWGVIQGNADGTFKPGNNVNRAELSAMWNRYDNYLRTQFIAKNNPVSPTSSTTDTTATTDSRTINLNTKGTLNGVSLTIKSVQDYKLYSQYSPPASGKKYVAVDVFIENNSGNTISINPFNFTLKDTDSYEYSVTFSTQATPALNTGDLESSRTLRGYLLYEVPTTVNLAELKYQVDYGNLGQFYVKLN